MWGPGRKMAFGAAPGSRSKVWYALADGNLSEVFFPYLDRVALHELRFFVSAGGGPPVDDAVDGQHSISWISPGVPAFTSPGREAPVALSYRMACTGASPARQLL